MEDGNKAEQGDDAQDDADPEATDQHTRGRSPVTRGGVVGTAGEGKTAGISMSAVGDAPDARGQDAVDQIVEGGARLGWGGTSHPTTEAAEARDRVLEDVEPEDEEGREG